MANGINSVTIAGSLGADAELRHTQNGNAVLNMRVAVNESFKNKDGERQERTEWVSCVLWGRRADAIAQYLTKGTTVTVLGKLATRSWQDKDGNKRYTTEVNVQEVVFAGGKKGGGSRQGGGEDPGGYPADDGFGDDSIPF